MVLDKKSLPSSWFLARERGPRLNIRGRGEGGGHASFLLPVSPATQKTGKRESDREGEREREGKKECKGREEGKKRQACNDVELEPASG